MIGTRAALKKMTGLILAATCLATPALAQDAFKYGWTLDGTDSHLSFLSVKKGHVMEVSTFATLSGGIDESGQAEFKVFLESIDTKIDLRNVRLRFLLFETFQYPEATVTATLDDSMLASLQVGEQTVIELPFSLDFHGIQKEMSAKVSVQLLDQNNVRVSSMDPVILKFEDFNLMAGRDKLQDTAEVSIVPTTAISFGLQYARNGQLASVVAARDNSALVAIETAGQLTKQECLTRFETLSRNDNISFRTGSAVLEGASMPLLNSVSEIVQRCPGMVVEVAGHTDSQGDASYNLLLSQQRADAVVQFLDTIGVPTSRLVGKGYGEAQPVASNTNQTGRSKNRRIEFSVVSFDTASN